MPATGIRITADTQVFIGPCRLKAVLVVANNVAGPATGVLTIYDEEDNTKTTAKTIFKNVEATVGTKLYNMDLLCKEGIYVDADSWTDLEVHIHYN